MFCPPSHSSCSGGKGREEFLQVTRHIKQQALEAEKGSIRLGTNAIRTSPRRPSIWAHCKSRPLHPQDRIGFSKVNYMEERVWSLSVSLFWSGTCHSSSGTETIKYSSLEFRGVFLLLARARNTLFQSTKFPKRPTIMKLSVAMTAGQHCFCPLYSLWWYLWTPVKDLLSLKTTVP